MHRRLVRDYETKPAHPESMIRIAMISNLSKRATDETPMTWYKLGVPAWSGIGTVFRCMREAVATPTTLTPLSPIGRPWSTQFLYGRSGTGPFGLASRHRTCGACPVHCPADRLSMGSASCEVVCPARPFAPPERLDRMKPSHGRAPWVPGRDMSPNRDLSKEPHGTRA